MQLSFKNDPAIKEALVKRMDRHIELDHLLQKATGQNGKGCTVWCALNNGDMSHGYTHEAFPTVLGLPEWLARLQDILFENLNAEDAKTFSAAWVKAIPVGKNLDPVKWKFCAFLMKENIERVLLLEIAEDLKKQVIDAITQVLAVHEDAIATGNWDMRSAKAAESTAWSAWSAAAATAESTAAAAAAAAAAAWSAKAAKAAESTAWSAWSAAAAWSAYKKYADKLLELLANA